MNGAPVGAVDGARIAHEIYNPASNQENQAFRKVSNGSVRKRSNSGLRAPLSTLPSGRAELSEHGHTPQRRPRDRTEEMAQPKDKSMNKLQVENQHNYYKRNGSNGNLSNAGSDDIPENMYRPEKEDAEGWIHREKLARIENEELQAAGINLAKARSRSKDALGDRVRTMSRDRLRDGFVASEGGVRDEKRQKVSSPIPTQVEAENGDEQTHWDLRTPEEIAADQVNGQAYTTPVLRKSGSKIPILSPNTNAATPDTSEPGSPVIRKRTMSGGSVSYEEELNPSKVRTKSSNWNDDGEGSTFVTRKPSSPTKVKQKSVSGGQGPPTGSKVTVGRKTSISKPPTTSPGTRPRTRGNDTDRPRTAVNPPEGDPPWLADMYKPDPRLPPDQQLIPTLAKKQRQMQWEENGMIPKTYDRDFTALAVHDNIEPPVSQPAEVENTTEKLEDSESWPLKPVTSARSAKETSSRPNVTNVPAATGGYSTMPKVSSPPMSMTSPKLGSPPNANVGAPSPNIGSTRQTSSIQQPAQRIQQRIPSDVDDEKAQKKGCGCCVVM